MYRARAVIVVLFALCCSATNNAFSEPTPKNAAESNKKSCLPSGDGFLRARLTGSIQAELDWQDADTECSGDVRPDSGVRMRFSHAFGPSPQRLVLVFGIPGLREGAPAKALPVNVTIIREGAGEFYGTRGDDKCTIDQLTQQPVADKSGATRRYRITARGFCTQPARAVVGNGSIFISRFDFLGRVDFTDEEGDSNAPVVASKKD
jgi:hypothetical protein